MNRLTIYLRARQLCISPVLFRKKIEELIYMGELDSTYRRLYSCSSKLSTVSNTIIENKMNSNRKIVFSHFIEEINQLYEMIVDNDDVDKYDDTQVAIYSGSLSFEERQNILENDRIEVLIMQIQTGCEGLNLQQYSDIYMVSPHWNPALEDQAVARCHRQGQLKETNVYRFIMKGSANLDGYIRDTQYEKRKNMEIVEPLFEQELITQFNSLSI
jgi:SNF2 family DNA or RNA helicase